MHDEPAPERSVPLNLYTKAAPLAVTVVANRRLTPDGSAHDVRHVVLRFPPDAFPYLEGQSAGIAPPGLNARGRPNVPRLYSIASPRGGDDGTGTTLALTVKRVLWTDEAGEPRQGLASNFLCDAQPGDVLPMTGPAGKDFLLPADPRAPMVMLATGTGVAPFRAFLHRWRTLPRHGRGLAWLVFGGQTRADLLYADEWAHLQAEPDFRVDYAISREQRTPDGRRLYVQDRVLALGRPLWAVVARPDSAVYVCGIRGMETGIEAALDELARQAGADFATVREQKRDAGLWHVETY